MYYIILMGTLGHFAHIVYFLVRQIKFTFARTSHYSLDNQIV